MLSLLSRDSSSRDGCYSVRRQFVCGDWELSLLSLVPGTGRRSLVEGDQDVLYARKDDLRWEWLLGRLDGDLVTGS